MSMQTKVHEINGVIVIDLSGRITLGDGSVLLRDQIREELAKGNKQILLNLADVSYMDSSGLGELISAYTSVKNRGGEVKLLKLTRRVRDLMEIVKLYTVFDIYDDEASGIASFTNED
jgi:anti-sigma B factor antagonist